MSGFEGHFELVEKHLENPFFVGTFKLSLVYFLVHDFDGDALVGGEVDAHLDPEFEGKYCENLPKPSLKTTLYFSSMMGHNSRYSWGRSRT